MPVRRSPPQFPFVDERFRFREILKGSGGLTDDGFVLSAQVSPDRASRSHFEKTNLGMTSESIRLVEWGQ